MNHPKPGKMRAIESIKKKENGGMDTVKSSTRTMTTTTTTTAPKTVRNVRSLVLQFDSIDVSQKKKKKINCWKCKTQITGQYVKTPNKAHYHTTCFVCFKCKKPLNDSSYLNINAKNYHPKCVTCTHCNESINLQKIGMDKSGKLYCEKHMHIADPSFKPKKKRTCAACKCDCDPNDGEVVKTMKTYYHAACFTCAKCGKKLMSTGKNMKKIKYGILDNKLYCDKDYQALISAESKCSGCDKPIGASEDALTIQNANFHYDCLKCGLPFCQKPLLGKKFAFKNGKA